MSKGTLVLFLLLSLSVSLSCQFLTPAQQNTIPTHAADPGLPAPSESVIPTAAPVGLNADGPYLIFAGQDGIYAANPDGSFPTRLADLDAHAVDLRSAISPDGSQLALVVHNEGGLDLVEVSIPDGARKTLVHLLDISQDELINNPTSPKALAYYAISEYENLAWQPDDGRLLAFTGAMDGPTSDVYTYDMQSGEIRRLTDGPSQAILPSWSPDGSYILHYGVSWVPPFGGAIVGYNRLDGVWAVRVSDGVVVDEPKEKSPVANFVAWADDTHYITYDSADIGSSACNDLNLHAVDILTGRTIQLMPWDFDGGVAQSPRNGAFVFASHAACAHSPGEGTFLLIPQETNPVQLTGQAAYEFHWFPESNVFQAYPEALFSPDGGTRYDPPARNQSFSPAVSKQGYQAWEVIQNQQGRLVVKAGSGDWKTVLDGSVKPLLWDQFEGNTLFFIKDEGAGSYTLHAASYPDFTPRPLGKLGRVSQAIWLP